MILVGPFLIRIFSDSVSDWMPIAPFLRLGAGARFTLGEAVHLGSGVIWSLYLFLCSLLPGIDEDEMTAEEPSAAVPEEIPPLEGEEDTSRMEEVD